MEQQLYNAKMLNYFRQRLEDGLCDIPYIKGQLKLAEEEEDYEKAIAIREALKELKDEIQSS